MYLTKNFINTPVSQKFWDEAVIVLHSESPVNRWRGLQNIYNILYVYSLMHCGIVADNTRGANMFQYEAASCTVAVYLGRPEQYDDGQAHLTNVFMINHGGGVRSQAGGDCYQIGFKQ